MKTRLTTAPAGRHLCRNRIHKTSKLRRSGLFRPDGALGLFDFGSTKIPHLRCWAERLYPVGVNPISPQSFASSRLCVNQNVEGQA